MRAFSSLLALILTAIPLRFCAQGVEHLATALRNMSDFNSDVQFEVLLPSAEEPVRYEVSLQSDLAEQTDTLSPCDYLIRWSAMSNSGLREGFSAYFNGNYYRYRNGKLQEYHFSDNPTTFVPSAKASPMTAGVHSQDQFAGLLPQYLSYKISQMANDSSYIFQFHPDTIVSGRRSIAIEGTRRNNGYDSEYFTYVFDYGTFLPRLIDRTTSPGSISEQIVTTTYQYPSKAIRIGYSEEELISQWPEIFEKYRQSNFRVENLAGSPLPDFTAQVSDSDKRLHHARGDKFDNPTLIVFIDPAVSTTKETINAVRDAMAQLPMSMQVLWAFKSNNANEIEDLAYPLQNGELALPSPNSLIRNCGINLYPTILWVDSDGIVQDMITGFNKSLSSDVIQKSILLH